MTTESFGPKVIGNFFADSSLTENGIGSTTVKDLRENGASPIFLIVMSLQEVVLMGMDEKSIPVKGSLPVNFAGLLNVCVLLKTPPRTEPAKSSPFELQAMLRTIFGKSPAEYVCQRQLFRGRIKIPLSVAAAMPPAASSIIVFILLQVKPSLKS